MMSERKLISRRHAVRQLAIVAAASCTGPLRGQAVKNLPQSRLGIVSYNCNLRSKWLKQSSSNSNLFEPLTFLKHCQALGGGGMQLSLGILEQSAAKELREYAEGHELFIEAIVGPPRDRADLPRFEAEIKTAREVGAKAARTVIIPGRRYEYFTSVAEFQRAERQGEAMVELSVPVVEKYQVPLAIENHKDQRIDQRVALLKRIGSPWVGACIDTGNSFALLDDPYGAIEALAPYAFSIHFKDQAVSEYDDGFLLGDVPLGQGSFDLKRMVRTLQQAKPGLQFCLEIITRDALQVPCLSDRYWQAINEPSGRELASALRFVRAHSTPSQSISELPLEEQVAVEDANIASSLAYARNELQI